MSLRDDFWRWRAECEQLADELEKSSNAAAVRKRLNALADEFCDRALAVERAAVRTTETTPHGPGIATRKGGPDGSHEEG
jgi:hypothetical protein